MKPMKIDQKLESIFIGAGIVMMDVVIYLLLELLLSIYERNTHIGSKSYQEQSTMIRQGLVVTLIYGWHAVNFIVISLAVYKKLVVVRKRRLQIKRSFEK